MAEITVIRLSQTPGAPAQWIRVDDAGARIGSPQAGSLAEAGEQIRGSKVFVLLPAEEVLTTHVEIPVRSGKRLLAALPFAMEEQVADDVDNLHFAAGKRLEDGSTPVAVINREQMQDWLLQLEVAGIKPAAMLSEIHGVAKIPGTVNVMVEGSRLLINDGRKLSLAIQDVQLEEIVASLQETDEDGGATHVVAFYDAATRDEYAKQIEKLQEDVPNFEVKILPDGIFPRLAATAAVTGGINLLQGTFATPKNYSRLFKPWKVAAALLLGLGVTWAAQNVLDYYNLHRTEQMLREQVTAEFRASFPWIGEVRDPEAQLNSLLRQSGSQGTAQVFLASLDALSKAITSAQEASIEAISYRSGVMDVRLTAPSVSVLDQIQRSISADGQFKASIQSTDQQDGKVMSRIQIQASDV
jgi:general secretion pathway protein L